MRIRTFLITIVAVTTALALSTGTAMAAPPTPPSASTAASELASLTVKTEGSTTGYSRDKFPHWHTVSGSCNTRETVLKRDGDNVSVGSDCYPTSGSWYSYYEGVTRTVASQISIDHIVPLAEAWRSGASSWTTARRQDFANDLSHPQLIAVTDNVNQSKGDQDPTTWQPPLSSYRCTYARMWINVKYVWGLKLQSAEKSALQTMLNSC